MRDGVPHLYVHLPYCRCRCPYCHIAVALVPGDGPPVLQRRLVEAVARELQWIGGELRRPLLSLYVGGGTPSCFPPGSMARLREALPPESVDTDTQWTVEANPEDLTDSLLEVWQAAGVNRVSLGIQSLSDPLLEALGRKHDGVQARSALARLGRSGTATWNVDVALVPIPGAGERLEEDLAAVISAGAPHVTLILPEARDLAGGQAEGLAGESADDPAGIGPRAGADWDDAIASLYLRARGVLEGKGFLPVDGIHFARPGHASVHLRALARGEAIRGVGPGARSLLGARRLWNLDDPGAYATRMGRGHSPGAGEEVVGPAALRLERLHLALASGDGFTPEAVTAAGERALDRWEALGWCRRAAGPGSTRRLHLTGEGWLRLDALTLELERHLPLVPPDPVA